MFNSTVRFNMQILIDYILQLKYSSSSKALDDGPTRCLSFAVCATARPIVAIIPAAPHGCGTFHIFHHWGRLMTVESSILAVVILIQLPIPLEVFSTKEVSAIGPH